MGHVISDIASFKMDSSTGVIKTVSGSVNAITIDGGQELVEDTGIGDTRRTVVAGLANATTVTVNGWIDSTTEAITTPILDGTSITKTIDIGLVSGQFLSGEAWPEAVSHGISVGALTTWSITFRASNGLTRTSVAQS
jgi:hypothetical protein